ncbi:hypothetical protein SAMN02800692_2009 [Luteibacter sp. UNC138MFCol5.1]|uniref:hypothetical protein n=1 Tax=Luteibacter sp. UNC138MFCol5.1 TaxID=1502774 RepID=UPI0008CA3DCA|nr:hypothetical protein [Luteibacter sp. UNC138MFCol5.1]SEO76621.1 hypothetical protein SAMN02800692_2009 [Luteibacter sp. UNC138MFCol5.1]
MNKAIQKDRAGFLERLGQLAGTTAWREPGKVGGGTPYAARGMTTENSLALALAMARKNERDVGPWVAYAMATGVEDHAGDIITWLADKLVAGTQHIGARNKDRMLIISAVCYRNVIRNESRYDAPKKGAKDFDLLVNIGVGWLWMTMEAAVERAEHALRGPARVGSRAHAKMSPQAA